MRQADPVRWLESDDALPSAAEREALRTLAAQAPTPERRAHMLARIEAVSSVRPTDARYLRSLLASLGAGALLLAAWIGWQHSQNTAANPAQPTVTAHPDAPPDPPAAKRRLAPAALPLEAASDPVAPPPGVSARPPSLPRRSALPAVDSPRDPSAELALLTPARQLLVVQPARALSLAEEHATRFARGVFTEERDFIRIEALLRLDQRAAATARATTFRRSYPRSTYLDRLTQLLASSEERSR